MSAVHWHEVEIQINQNVTLDGATVDAQRFVVPRLADFYQIFVVFRVVIVKTVWIKFAENRRADHALHFPRRHFAVQGISNNQMHVVHAVRRAHIEHDFEHRLAQIRRLHRRQRQRNIVHRDRHAHSRFKLRVKRFRVNRMIDRVTNRRLAIRQTFNRRIRINHARADRNVFENKILAKRHNARRAVFVDVHN
jgi:hypothetical protein